MLDWSTMDFEQPDDFAVIRTEVRRLCDKYGNEYWRGLEPDRYPEEFVADLTRHGWLAALIPEQYGGGGLSLAGASVIHVGGETIYDHAIATYALCEACGLSGSSLLRPAVQKAIGGPWKALGTWVTSRRSRTPPMSTRASRSSRSSKTA